MWEVLLSIHVYFPTSVAARTRCYYGVRRLTLCQSLLYLAIVVVQRLQVLIDVHRCPHQTEVEGT